MYYRAVGRDMNRRKTYASQTTRRRRSSVERSIVMTIATLALGRICPVLEAFHVIPLASSSHLCRHKVSVPMSMAEGRGRAEDVGHSSPFAASQQVKMPYMCRSCHNPEWLRTTILWPVTGNVRFSSDRAMLVWYDEHHT